MALINLIAIIAGIYFVFGVMVKPAFFWEGQRMKHRRNYLGEQNTRLLYGILGVVLIGAGFLVN